jgi:hypothetical protein
LGTSTIFLTVGSFFVLTVGFLIVSVFSLSLQAEKESTRARVSGIALVKPEKVLNDSSMKFSPIRGIGNGKKLKHKDVSNSHHVPNGGISLKKDNSENNEHILEIIQPGKDQVKPDLKR